MFNSSRLIRSAALSIMLAAMPLSADAQEHLHTGASGIPQGIPDFCATASIQAVKNGPWSDPATWQPSRTPRAGDAVVIPAAISVSYDVVSDSPIGCLRIAGQLAYRAGANGRLTVGTVLVMDTGTFNIGTVGESIAASATAELVFADQPLDTSFDPEQFGTGLIVFGRMSLVGAMKAPSFVRLTTEPAAGDSSLSVASALQGWSSGDRVILPDSRELRRVQWDATDGGPNAQIEERTIASAESNRISLARALTYPHLGARDANGSLDFLPHVANLSRNVIVRSANPTGTRGHILALLRANVDIRYALLKDLGRTKFQRLDSTTMSGASATHIGTNQIGRYPIHFHHDLGPTTTPANGYQFTLMGSAIDGSTKWGIAIHNSHYGLVSDNVVYNTAGAGIVTEDGSESFNVIERNFVLRVGGEIGRGVDRGVDDTGWEGVGFWFRGANNYVRDNVTANALQYGYTYIPWYAGLVSVPQFKGADTRNVAQSYRQDSNGTPLLEFARNEVYGTPHGLTLWWIGAQDTAIRASVGWSVVKDFSVWHVWGNGYFGYHTSRILFDHYKVRGDINLFKEGGESDSIGMLFNDYLTNQNVVRNADIQNIFLAIRAPLMTETPGAPLSPGNGVFLVEDSLFRTWRGVEVETMYSVGGSADLQRRKVIVKNTLFKPATATRTWGPEWAQGAYGYRLVFTMQNGAPNLIVRDEVHVFDADGVPGENFRVYGTAQAPSFVVPQTKAGDRPLIGSPEAGLTNAQNWAKYGIAIGGEVAACDTRRAEIDGFRCAATEAWVPPFPVTLAKAPRPPGAVLILK